MLARVPGSALVDDPARPPDLAGEREGSAERHGLLRGIAGPALRLLAIQVRVVDRELARELGGLADRFEDDGDLGPLEDALGLERARDGEQRLVGADEGSLESGQALLD